MYRFVVKYWGFDISGKDVSGGTGILKWGRSKVWSRRTCAHVQKRTHFTQLRFPKIIVEHVDRKTETLSQRIV